MIRACVLYALPLVCAETKVQIETALEVDICTVCACLDSAAYISSRERGSDRSAESTRVVCIFSQASARKVVGVSITTTAKYSSATGDIRSQYAVIDLRGCSGRT